MHSQHSQNAAFLWGASTASYQIEGHPLADGASPSIWHRFSHRAGKVANNENGDVACDHYHRWAGDIEQMGRLGLQAYRFSVSWPRIYPEPDRLNPKGLDFYERLVDGLLRRGIQPFLTLFHWDAPQWLEDRGGFLRREAVDHICRYAQALYDRLGDRVRHWVTINEPMIFSAYGYVLGAHAPGRRLRLRQMCTVSHHLLLAHSRLVRQLHQSVPGASAGIAQHQVWTMPADPTSRKDLRAARRMDALLNRLYMDPLFHGRYPPEALKTLGLFFPRRFERDLSEMTPGDFLGLNYYTSKCYRHAPLIPVLAAAESPIPGAARSPMWEIYPDGLLELLRRLRSEYGNPPCYITENGFPTAEAPGEDPLSDPGRIDYLREHIERVRRAAQEGSDLRGFFVWSLLDNFEWSEGYAMRFGLLRVDFQTQERSWRQSAAWYRDLIRGER